ncbi:hypothetical protein MPSEU_000682200 [Mayamaea pseudoterrestris]|nr:hypothetical protein MPSEU_000682200 [Mayamaea pseudoterrestris]
MAIARDSHSTESDLWLAIAHKLGESLYNFSQVRKYSPILSPRSLGFTEQWCKDWNELTDKEQHVWQSTSPLLDTPYPQKSVTLLQFEPAWEDQLALAIAKIEFVVVNTTFASTEAIGQLPCLYDLQQDQAPVIVGRATRNELGAKNSILQYLVESRKIDFDHQLPDSLRSLSKLYENMITTTLSSSLSVLRHNDPYSWHQVYRQQYQAAGGGRFASLQTWSMKMFGRSILSFDERKQSMAQAVQQARRVFELLEQQILSNADQSCYLMGTKEPASVDISLWGALATALTNVHLVIVLADFPALCAYAQRIWNSYFMEANTEQDWMEWNVQENARNAFCNLPLAPKSDMDLKNAIDLMEQLSPQSRSLHERLVAAKDARAMEEEQLPDTSRSFYTWHQWRTGGNYAGVTNLNGGSRDESTEESEKLRNYIRSDELWMAATGIGILASVFLFGASRPE